MEILMTLIHSCEYRLDHPCISYLFSHLQGALRQSSADLATKSTTQFTVSMEFLSDVLPKQTNKQTTNPTFFFYRQQCRDLFYIYIYIQYYTHTCLYIFNYIYFIMGVYLSKAYYSMSLFCRSVLARRATSQHLCTACSAVWICLCNDIVGSLLPAFFHTEELTQHN